ncbi:MAG: hypothetical protein HN348_12705 [Proteobacteria bacterium]|nr:hypothetical protein [Pseudomonadota bacterium]
MNKATNMLLVVAFGGLVACGDETIPEGSTQLLVPDDIDLHWDPSFNGIDDGLGALIPVDLMVYEGGTGEPVGFVELYVETIHDTVVFPDAVEQVVPEVCTHCPFTWDAYRDQYFTFLPEDDEPNNVMVTTTDADGLARVYVFVDAFPADDGDFSPVSVTVSVGLDEDSFYLLPQ